MVGNVPVSSLYVPSAVMKLSICVRVSRELAPYRACLNSFGPTSATNSPMIVTTTSISISVTPARRGAFSIPFRRLRHGYTFTSLMLVIASSILKISAPINMPITRITTGSKIEVNRLMDARVSVS